MEVSFKTVLGVSRFLLVTPNLAQNSSFIRGKKTDEALTNYLSFYLARHFDLH